MSQDIRESVETTQRAAPTAVYVLQGYCPACDGQRQIYGGRFFAGLTGGNVAGLACAEREWHERRNGDLQDFWPRDELPHTYMTHHANFALPRQGYTHWWKMFNARQLLVLGGLLRAISRGACSGGAREQVLGAFQQYVRMQNMFVIWHQTYDKIAPFMSNPNYAPKARIVENNLYGKLGYGTFSSCAQTIVDGLIWCGDPEELYVFNDRASTRSMKVATGDHVLPGADIRCCSSSDLACYQGSAFDLVITDPPFGDNIFYSDLANFFHAWLRLPLRKEYPELFDAVKTPNAQEALAPRLLPEAEANEYYRVRLTACWAEAFRVLKDGGLLAFTFHHSEDSQWALVLQSLFESNFYLEQTYPIASDEMKGEGGQFGAKGTEYDMIHVCRKRLDDPAPVSWPKMRQWVKAELKRLRRLLDSYKTRELSDADIRTILRGKALEFYSRHYGQVFTSENEPLSIGHALLGINQLLDEDTGQAGERPPSVVQPLAYQFLRLFGSHESLGRDEVGKSLRGTGIVQRELEQKGWVKEEDKTVYRVPIPERFEKARLRPRKEMKTEIDQAHFLIGAAMPGSKVNVEEELTRETWMIRRSVEAVLDWYAKTALEPEVQKAAALAGDILRRTLQQNRAKLEEQQGFLFDDLYEE